MEYKIFYGERLINAQFNEIIMSKPVKDQVDNAIKMISAVELTLDNQMKKLKEKDSIIFSQVVANLKKGNRPRAKMLANELSVIRRSIKMVSTSHFALNTIKERLITVTDYGEFVSAISPALAITKSIQKDVSMTAPEASNGLSRIASDLNDIITNSGTPDIGYSPQAGEEAEKIIQEAAKLAEQRTMKTLPEVPNTLGEAEAI